MRAVPHVKFLFDQSISRGRDLSSLIEQAREKDTSDLDSNGLETADPKTTNEQIRD
ncbi:MAG: hypothetical protein Q9M92_01825 [Enterobacterales bacterium]|nr:hypothetical protein [Enterobacterales bacterium]